MVCFVLFCFIKFKFKFNFLVKSWDGGVSNLNRVISETNKNTTNFRDEYDEEFDLGKVRLPNALICFIKFVFID